MASLAPNSGRQSPFRRQPSTNSPVSLRASTPNTSPTKPSLLSPARGGSVPPEAESPSINRALHNDLTARAGASVTGTGNLLKKAGGVSTSTAGTASTDTPANRFQSTAASPAATFSDVFDSPTLQSRAAPSLAPTNMRQQAVDSTVKSTASALTRSSVAHNNVPGSLLRSFRESFEVLDPNATGSLSTASLPPVLEQLGLSNDVPLSSFFPHGKQNMHLAAYLDLLCAPFSQLSSPEELAAAFSAFDVDDSGQIDAHDLKHALFRTMAEPNETNPGAKLSESEIDSVLESFTGRRAFGSRGYNAQKGGSKGDVFRWRDFLGNLNGGPEEKTEPVTA